MHWTRTQKVPYSFFEELLRDHDWCGGKFNPGDHPGQMITYLTGAVLMLFE